MQTGESFYDWIWKNENGDIVAYGDRDFRDRIFGSLMNRFNNEAWDVLDAFAEIAPIAGFDFYHYKSIVIRLSMRTKMIMIGGLSR